MRGSTAAKTAVELTPIDWTYCDGIDLIEIVDDMARLVFYVTDVAADAQPQRRKNLKVVMPVAAAMDALGRLQGLLIEAGRQDRRVN
jgi:hypothetical protein